MRPLSQLSKVIRVFRAINLAQIELFNSEVRVQVQASLRLSLALNPTRRGDQIQLSAHKKSLKMLTCIVTNDTLHPLNCSVKLRVITDHLRNSWIRTHLMPSLIILWQTGVMRLKYIIFPTCLTPLKSRRRSWLWWRFLHNNSVANQRRTA